ncbi:hypothetical protein D3C81_533730 [compost metagenome]
MAELGHGIGERAAFDAATAIFQLDEDLALALAAHADHLAGKHGLHFRAPALLAATTVAVGAPDLFHRAEVGADQIAHVVAPGVERVAAEVEAQRVALAVEALQQRPFVGFLQLQVDGLHARLGAAEQRILAGRTLARHLFGGLDHFRQLQHQRGTVVAQLIQGTAVDHRFQRAPVELGRTDAGAEIEQIGVVAAAQAFVHHRFAGALADALDRAQAVLDGVRRGRFKHEGGLVHLRRQHGQAEVAHLVQEADHLFGVVHVRRQRRGHELGRVMALEPGRLVTDQGVGGSVRLVEAVAGELLHQVEDRIGLGFADAVLGRTFAEDLAVLGHFRRHLLAHRTAQQVGAAQRVAADDLRHLHHLLLVHHDAVGVAQDALGARIGILHVFAPVLAVDEGGNQVHRAGPIQRHQRDQVLETVGLGVLQQAAHARGLELEHRTGIARGEDVLVGGRIVQRQLGDVHRRNAGALVALVDRLHRPVDDRQRAQAEEVELHQADFFNVVLVELGDRILAAALFIVFGEQRAELAQRFGCDHHATGVLAGVAGEVFQLPRKVDQVADIVLALVALDQLGRGHLAVLALTHRILQRDAEDVRDQLGDTVDQAIGEAEHAAGVAHHRLGRHGAVGDDLADPLAAILARDVVDDFVAAVHAEVDVEVGHRHAFGVEEALEQQVVRQRVQIGDLQRPRHQRAGTGTTARADRDALRFTPLDEVGHDQEVAGEAHLDDGVQLELEAVAVILRGHAGRDGILFQARGQALARFTADPAVQRLLVGHRIVGQEVGAQAHLDVAALGQRQRVVDRIGDVGKQRAHLLGRLQVLLVAVLAWALGVIQHAAGGDAHACFVRAEIGRRQEAHVVAGDHRQAALAGGHQRELVEALFAVTAGAGQLQVQAVAEHALPVGQLLFGQIVLAIQRQAPGQAVTAGQGEQVGVAGLQPVRMHGHAALGAMAFHPRPGQQPRQAQVALAVAAQQRHPPRVLAFLGDHHVGAGDGLDAHAFGGLVELDQGEQVVEVGHRQRRQAEFDRARQQVGLLGFFRVSLVRLGRHADGRVRQRELGVDVEMYEAGVGHAGPGWSAQAPGADAGIVAGVGKRWSARSG